MLSLRLFTCFTMDLQAILDASDSDDPIGSSDPSSGEGDSASNVDLERILREDDDDIDVKTMSTISTAAHHYHLTAARKQHHGTEDSSFYGNMLGDQSFSNNTGHNPADFAILQQILCEDEDEARDWLVTDKNESQEVGSARDLDVDAILDAINSDDEDLEAELRSLTANISINSRNESYIAKAVSPSAVEALDPVIGALTREDTVITPVMKGSNQNDSKRKEKTTTGPSLTDRPIVEEATIPKKGGYKRSTEEEISDEALTEKALAYASTYERRLLKPGHRDIVSPLMVKRRLKPRLELDSRMQKKHKEQQSKEEISKITAASGPAPGTPRFGFSGVMENKTMPGLSTKLLEISKEKRLEIGLPTALSVNSKFIAIGTQKGIILVFDLFEVLRQKLGQRGEHMNASEGAWSASHGSSVTSIDIAMNGENIIAGYASGVVALWDVIRGTVLKTVSETYPSPITYVRFCSEREIKAVTVDTAGLVNKLNFSKNILWSAYSLETECLLDGTAGQILAIDVLPSMSAFQQMPKDATPDLSYLPILEKLALLALSSERSSFVVAVEPGISVLHRWSRPSEERIFSNSDFVDNKDNHYLPCLSWGWALVLGGGNVATPILARAWGCCIQLLQASFPTLDGVAPEPETMHWPAFGIHDEFDSSAPVVSLEWLGERSLVYLTVTNELIVADTVMMTLLERLDLSGLKLVYAEFSLSRAADNERRKDNGGPLCTTFQNSVRTSDNRLLILCQEEVKSVSILGAKRRIAALEQDGEWLEALALALDHYENTIKSQEDRRRDPEGKRDLSKHPEFSNIRRSEDEEWIAKLLIRYLNLAVENAPEPSSRPSTPERSSSKVTGRLDLAQSHFQMLAGVCIEFCVVTRRLDLLFGPVFRRFHSVGFLPVFLDVLEPYVLNDKLDYIAPEAMAYFVEHCKATNGIATVERCLLHMDVTIMDFDTILSLLRKNEMYSALCYVFSHGLDDFITPLEILLERIFDGADEGKVLAKRRPDGVPQSQFERYGYKAILYLQHCFNGQGFPEKTPLKPDDKLKSLRPQILRFLNQEQYSPSRTVKKHGQGLKAFGHRTLRYPYTHILLMVDTRATLDTISLALDAPDADFAEPDSAFESIGGWEVEVGEDARTEQSETSDPVRSPDRQKIISMLSSIILPDDDTTNKPMEGLSNLSQSPRAVEAFLDFMAKYLLSGVVRANKSVTYMILERMATRYSRANEPEARQAAQEETIELLTALPRNAYDPDQVLKLVEAAGIHRAALTLHQQGASSWHQGVDHMDRRSHHFRSVIDCYLEDADPLFRKEVFAYAKKECASDVNENDSKPSETLHSTSLRKALCSKMPDLVNLDPILSAQLVAEIFIEDIDEVVNSLVADDGGAAQFQFLNAIISGDLAKVDAVAGPVLNANLTMDHHQVYLSLMAKLHPDMVYEYLSTHDNYRAEESLKLCQQYEIADASSYLLERMGNVSSALQLILQTLEGRMMGLKRTIRGMGTEFYRSNASRQFLSDWNKEESKVTEQQQKQEREVDRVKRILVVALDICERNSGTSTSRSEHGSQLWFNVLDRLINAKGFLRLSKEQPAHAKVMAGVLSQLLQLTMQRMVSSVPLPDLVRKVTTDHSGSRLGELREMVESLLSTYGFEVDVFRGSVKVMHDDVHAMEREHRRLKLKGSVVTSITQVPLREKGAAGGRYGSQKGRVLLLGERGDASFADGGKMKANAVATVGLGGALNRLRSRRAVRNENTISDKTTWDRAGDMMTVSERLYNAGESSEAAEYGERLVGVLGDAENFGYFR